MIGAVPEDEMLPGAPVQCSGKPGEDFPETQQGSEGLLPQTASSTKGFGPYHDPAEERRIAIFERYSHAVPFIKTEHRDAGSPILGMKRVLVGVGSGAVVSKDQGIILTNHHVIEDASSITVTFLDGTTERARLLTFGSRSDLAVIQVARVPDDVVEIPLGTSGDLRVGQTVLAIGNQFGRYQCSMTRGIISGVKREFKGRDGSPLTDLIQVDCAVNQGNSGGPLFDMHGRLIGLNTVIESAAGGFNGVAFAVSVDRIEETLNRVFRPSLGMLCVDSPEGVRIARVVPDSPAGEARIPGYLDLSVAPEDAWLIRALNDATINTVEELNAALDRVDTRKPLTLVIESHGHRGELVLTPRFLYSDMKRNPTKPSGS